MVVITGILLCVTTIFGCVLLVAELVVPIDTRALLQLVGLKGKKDKSMWTSRSKHPDNHELWDNPDIMQSSFKGQKGYAPCLSHVSCGTREHSPATSFSKYLSRIGSSAEDEDSCASSHDNFGQRILNRPAPSICGVSRAGMDKAIMSEMMHIKAVDFMEKKAETIRHQISAKSKKSSWKRNIVITVKRSYSWLTFGRAIKTERPDISRWEAMRWKSRSLTVLAVAVLTIGFCIICSIIYFSVGGWIAGLTILMHSVILVFCFVAIRYSLHPLLHVKHILRPGIPLFSHVSFRARTHHFFFFARQSSGTSAPCF